MTLQAVPTNKPNIQTYLTLETYKKIEKIAAGESLSGTVEQILNEVVKDSVVVVHLPNKLNKALDASAKKGFRTKKQQIVLLLAQALGLDPEDLINS